MRYHITEHGHGNSKLANMHLMYSGFSNKPNALRMQFQFAEASSPESTFEGRFRGIHLYPYRINCRAQLSGTY